ncbi:uncharacterized protein LOC106025945 isoform X4 [Cavia porcellus]|uniref:uncharacterized protein LOC106025945 isoform X4 n=1 Tax=Cavia porcellus TaxID=10141 RepID=UPI002FDF29A9
MAFLLSCVSRLEAIQSQCWVLGAQTARAHSVGTGRGPRSCPAAPGGCGLGLPGRRIPGLSCLCMWTWVRVARVQLLGFWTDADPSSCPVTLPRTQSGDGSLSHVGQLGVRNAQSDGVVSSRVTCPQRSCGCSDICTDAVYTPRSAGTFSCHCKVVKFPCRVAPQGRGVAQVSPGGVITATRRDLTWALPCSTPRFTCGGCASAPRTAEVPSVGTAVPSRVSWGVGSVALEMRGRYNDAYIVRF